MASIRPPANSPWRLLKRVVRGLSIILLSLIALSIAVFVIADILIPPTWNKAVVETGDIEIDRAQLTACGVRYPVQIHAGRIEGEFRQGGCAVAPELTLRTAPDTFRCEGVYLDTGLDTRLIFGPRSVLYRIENGQCRFDAVESRDRREARKPYRLNL